MTATEAVLRAVLLLYPACCSRVHLRVREWALKNKQAQVSMDRIQELVLGELNVTVSVCLPAMACMHGGDVIGVAAVLICARLAAWVDGMSNAPMAAAVQVVWWHLRSTLQPV